jgi:hypothetical protein
VEAFAIPKEEVAEVLVAVPKVNVTVGSTVTAPFRVAAPLTRIVEPKVAPPPTSNREVEAFATPSEEVAEVLVAVPKVSKRMGSIVTVLLNCAAPWKLEAAPTLNCVLETSAIPREEVAEVPVAVPNVRSRIGSIVTVF